MCSKACPVRDKSKSVQMIQDSRRDARHVPPWCQANSRIAIDISKQVLSGGTPSVRPADQAVPQPLRNTDLFDQVLTPQLPLGKSDKTPFHML